MENRNGLIVDAMVTHADGTAERDAAMLMVYRRWKKHQPVHSVGADKAYDTHELVQVLRDSAKSAMPSSTNRFFQREMVGAVVSSRT
jgi:hypothetical protein